MLSVKLICVGKLSEKYYLEAQKEYEKRLKKFVKLNIIELQDEKTSTNKKVVLAKEAERINAKLQDEYIIALDIKGESFSSEQWASDIQDLMTKGVSKICFIIGGSYGIDQSVLTKVHKRISFSKFTFSHNLARIIFLEQFFRINKIISNEPYHK